MKEKFYITTPIYYPSRKFTLGNCYTTVACDAIARFNRMLGKDVFYLTGTDEHGQKISELAKEAGVSEIEYLNEIVADAKNLWKMLDISYDDFIRTTEERHIKTVNEVLLKLKEKGEIYKSVYKGWYCTPCESFWTDAQLIDGKCPDCGRDVHEEEEESYFFKLSKYRDRILDLYKNNEEFLLPKSRVHEMVNNFLKDGLKDLCISRTSVKWGIPVSFDKKHTVYVWVDALSNYISVLGAFQEDDSKFKKYWPADVHVVGKEIVRFHAIIWPALLMALDLPLPKRILGHGWLLFGGDKLSKSKKNTSKDVLDPRVLYKHYGSDPIRLYLLKEVPFGSDGIYTQELFLKAYNSYLANNVGNLLSRTVSMINKYREGKINHISSDMENDLGKKFQNDVKELIENSFKYMEKYDVSKSIESVLEIFNRANKYIDETEPWALAKTEGNKELDIVLYNLSEVILKGATLLLPFLTDKVKEIFKAYNMQVPVLFENIKEFNTISNINVKDVENIYPRLDINKEQEILWHENEEI